MNLEPYQISSVFLRDEMVRKNFIQKISIDFKAIKYGTENIPTSTIWSWEKLDYYILWYLNKKFDIAVEQAKTTVTKNQHTVPRFANESFGLFIPPKQKVQRKIAKVDLLFSSGIKSLKIQELENKHIFSEFPTRNISVYKNIYDLKGRVYPDLPTKTVECFAKGIETDAGEIISAVVKNPRKTLNFHERTVLSCYGLLQLLRVEKTRFVNESNYARMLDWSKRLGPNIDLSRDKTIENFKLYTEDFGAYIISMFNLEFINYIFARDWSFLKAPGGLVLTEYPMVPFNWEDEWTPRGLLNNHHYMIPLNRNLLWNLEGPGYNFPNHKISSAKGPLNKQENIFVNNVIAQHKLIRYCHPDDGAFIFKNFTTELDIKKNRWYPLAD